MSSFGMRSGRPQKRTAPAVASAVISESTPAVEVQQAERFLTLLDETAEAWCFRTFAEASHASGGGRNYTGALADVAVSLQLDNGNGRGVFVVVNEGGQDADSITRVRAVFADFDPPKTGAMPAAFPLEPHVIVESSPGKHHAYWLVDGLTLDEFTPVQRAIIGAFKSDPSVNDLPRVMRLPGFMHRKGEPFRTRIIHESGALPYSADAIRSAFKPAPAAKTPPAPEAAGAIGDGARNDTLASIAGTMRRRGLDADEIEAALVKVNAKRCKPPLSSGDLRTIAQSVARYEPADPILINIANGHAANDEPAHLVEVSLTGIMDAEPEPPTFVMDPWIPRRVPTLFAGHGGVGKSTAVETIGAHAACGIAWAGFPVEQCRVVFVSLEDEARIVCYRLRRIIEAYQLPAAHVIENMRIFDGTDVEAALMVEASDKGVTRLIETPMMADIVEAARGAGLIIIDNASDAYAGNENARLHVRVFMRRLSVIAKANNAGLVLLAHIDKDSAKNGSKGNSYSGSTAWHNSARSRLALVSDEGAIELRHEKANFGPKADPVRLQHNAHGVLVPMAGDGSRASVAAITASADAEAILAVLTAAIEAGETVTTAASGSVTAWHALAHLPELGEQYRGKVGKQRVHAALVRLAREGRIVREEYQKPTRKKGERWLLAHLAVKSAA